MPHKDGVEALLSPFTLLHYHEITLYARRISMERQSGTDDCGGYYLIVIGG